MSFYLQQSFYFHLVLTQRIGTQALRPLRHFIAGGSEERSIGRTDVKHLHPLWLNAHFLQQFLGLLDPLFCSQISFQEMTIAFYSASHEGGISATFEGFQQVERIHFAGAHQLDDPDVRRIFQAHRTSQVSG